MSETLECGNCGAVLLESDLFCGECGAPRSAVTPPPEPSSREKTTKASATVPMTALPLSASEPASSLRSRRRLWKLIVITLGLLSVLLCFAGLLTFLLFGLTDSEIASPRENWLYSALCCLVPLTGTGSVSGLAALGIWFARLRKR